MIVIIPKFNFISNDINYNTNTKYVILNDDDIKSPFCFIKDINDKCGTWMSSDHVKSHFYTQKQLRQLKINSI